MKFNIQSLHTPGLLLATNLVQLANSIAHARALVTAAYSHAREIATAEANHAAADFCGDPYAHNCGRPHCRPSDSYTGPQPPLERRFFEVDAVAEAALPAAGVPEGWRELAQEAADALQVFTGHDSGPNLRHRYGENWWEPLNQLRDKLRAMLAAAPTPPASEQQRAVVMPDEVLEMARSLLSQAKNEILHMAECAENLGEDLEDEDGLSEEVSEARALAEGIGEFLRLNPHLAKGEGV